MSGIAFALAGFFVLWALFMDPVFSDPTKKGSEHNHTQWDVLLFLLLIPVIGLLLAGGAAVLGAAAIVGGLILLTALTIPSTSRVVQSARKQLREQAEDEHSTLSRVRRRIGDVQRTVYDRRKIFLKRMRHVGGRTSSHSLEAADRADRSARSKTTNERRRYWKILQLKKTNSHKWSTSNDPDIVDTDADNASHSALVVRSQLHDTRVIDRDQDVHDTDGAVHGKVEPVRASTHEQVDSRSTSRTTGSADERELGVWDTEVDTSEHERRSAFGRVILDTPRNAAKRKAVSARTLRTTTRKLTAMPLSETFDLADLLTQNDARAHSPRLKGRSRLSRMALAQRLASEHQKMLPPPASMRTIGLGTRKRVSDRRGQGRA